MTSELNRLAPSVDLTLLRVSSLLLRGFPMTARDAHSPVDWFSIKAPWLPLLPFAIASGCVAIPGAAVYFYLARMGRHDSLSPPADFGYLVVQLVITAFSYCIAANAVLALWLGFLIRRTSPGHRQLSSLIMGARRILYFAAIPYTFLALGVGYWSTVVEYTGELRTPSWLDVCAAGVLLIGSVGRIVIIASAFGRETSESCSTAAGIATLGALDAWLMLAFFCQLAGAALM